MFEPDKVDECCGLVECFRLKRLPCPLVWEDKLKNHMATGAEYITGADSSCMMHMKGIVDEQNLPIKFIHIVQILAAGL